MLVRSSRKVHAIECIEKQLIIIIGLMLIPFPSAARPNQIRICFVYLRTSSVGNHNRSHVIITHGKIKKKNKNLKSLIRYAHSDQALIKI